MYLVSIGPKIHGPLKPDLHSPVIIAPIRRHDAFIADLRPEIFIEEIVDPAEDPKAAFPEIHLRSQVPDLIGGNEALEAVVRIGPMIIDKRADEGDLHRLPIAVDHAGLEKIIRRIDWNLALGRSGSELRVEKGRIAEEIQATERTLRSSV